MLKTRYNDTLIELYKTDTSGNQQLIDYDDDSGYGTFSKIESSFTLGEYFIIIKSYNLTSNVDSTLRIDAVPSGTISIGSTEYISGVYYKEFSFTPSTTATYRIETNAYSSGSDTFLTLYDNKHNELFYDDDSNGNYYSKIEKSLQSGIRYYIKVRAYNGGNSVYCTLKYTNVGSATNPSVSISSPQGGGYFLKNSTNNPKSYSISAYATNSLGRAEFIYRGNIQTTLSNSSGLLTGTWQPVNWFKPNIDSQGYSWWPNIKINAFNNTGVGYQEINGYVSQGDNGFYTGIDNTWGSSYVSPTNNRFRGIGTGHANLFGSFGTYNCLAYAVGITNNWQWGSWSGGPTLKDLKDYMSSKGYTYTTNSSNARVVYYDGGHFAKISSGTITSKWGGTEVVYSSQIDAFKSVPVTAQAALSGVESAHNPYGDNINSLKPIRVSGPVIKKIRVHFTQIQTEANYDNVRILDVENNIIATYTGSYTDIWSSWVDGPYIGVHFQTDGSVSNYYGYKVDKVEIIYEPSNYGTPKYYFQ